MNQLGRKKYELTNHLGNVLAVITDRKMVSSGGLPSVYEAVVIMKSDYYPFGMEMHGRTYQTDQYRFGYNGMEQDPEAKGQGNSYTTEFRQYDPRLGRWMSLDPLMMRFPWMSPYVGFDDNPVVYTDPYGSSSTNESGPGGPPVGIPAQKTNEKGELVDWAVGDMAPDQNLNMYKYAGDGKWDAVETQLEDIVISYDSPNVVSHQEYLRAIFWRGYGDAFGNAESIGLSDLFGGNHTDDYALEEEKRAYLNGRIAGDVSAAAAGAAQSEGGYVVAGAGLATGPGAVVISTGGLVVAVHGHGTTAVATIDLIRSQLALSRLNAMGDAGESGSEASSSKSSGKNGKHANQKAKESAKEKYESAKKEYDTLSSKRNKTPADKKQLQKLEREVKHLKQKSDWNGEAHSRNAKGNR